jgi:large subunit ribosomal protein L21
MFAVIKAGGKQYRVAPNDILRIERIEGQPGDRVELGSVLMVGGADGVTLGAPLVEGAAVAAEVVEQSRADKIIVFKRKRRKNHRRRNGHRQHQTVLRVTEILTGGTKPGKAKTAKAEAAPEGAEKAPAKKAAPKKAGAKKAPAKKAAAKKAAKKSAKQEE